MLGPDEELFPLRDDPNEVVAQHGTMKTGISQTIALDRNKIEVPIRYRDRLTVADMYELPEHLMLHLFCPRCMQALQLTSERKRIRWLRAQRRIDIEAFRCTYPGCGLHVEVVDSIAKDVAA